MSAQLFRDAVAATRFHYGEPPALGMVTFVDVDAVRPKRDPGRCFIRAGFKPVGYTKRRDFLALQLLPGDMPPPAAAIGMQSSLAGL